MVSGHVDGVGEIVAIAPEPSQTVMSFRLPQALADQVLLKGSITIDGVSLTITAVEEGGRRISVALIPHTLEVTTLGGRSVGERVNLEADMVGRWVRRMLGPVLDELRKKDG